MFRWLLIAFLVLPLATAEAQHDQRHLAVLSYNINALPRSLQGSRQPQLERIAEVLRARRRAGDQPDIVVLQEAFSDEVAVITETTGYRYVVLGPDRKDGRRTGTTHWTNKTRERFRSIDRAQKLTGSGLVVLTDLPVLASHQMTYDNDACAGFDCLSNKGLVHVRLSLGPDVPPLDLINTHMNSLRSAKVPQKLAIKAHQAQVDLLEGFLNRVTNSDHPVILAGDLNTRSPERYRYLVSAIDLLDTAEECLLLGCDLGPSVPENAVLYDTNDKQFYRSSAALWMAPQQIARNFAETVEGQPLSDHLGYEVVYRITRGPTAASLTAD